MQAGDALAVVLVGDAVGIPRPVQLLPRHVAGAAVRVPPQALLGIARVEAILEPRDRHVVVEERARRPEHHAAGVEVVTLEGGGIRVVAAAGAGVAGKDVRRGLGRLVGSHLVRVGVVEVVLLGCGRVVEDAVHRPRQQRIGVQVQQLVVLHELEQPQLCEHIMPHEGSLAPV